MKRFSSFALFAVLAAVVAPYSAHAQKGKDGENREVIVVNDRASDMVRLYAARTTTADWEENILSQQAIPAGTKVKINFDDGTGACEFDFRAVFRDNVVVHYWRINVCQELYWRIADDK
jgi:hypothetical protein